MDVFEAVNSRIACRWFLDTPVEPDIVRNLIEGAARAASNGNLQPWNVHAVTGEPLGQIKRQALVASIPRLQFKGFNSIASASALKVFPDTTR